MSGIRNHTLHPKTVQGFSSSVSHTQKFYVRKEYEILLNSGRIWGAHLMLDLSLFWVLAFWKSRQSHLPDVGPHEVSVWRRNGERSQGLGLFDANSRILYHLPVGFGVVGF